MNLEQQCISLEYAKRLKELGIKHNSLFYWIETKKDLKFVIAHHYDYHSKCYYLDPDDSNNQRINSTGCDCCSFDWEIVNKYSAFTESDLLALLPHRITTKENEPFNSYRLRIEKSLKIVGEKIEPNVFILLDENIKNYYVINYYCDTTSEGHGWTYKSLTKNMTDENSANALAKMVIFLIENDLLNVKDS